MNFMSEWQEQYLNRSLRSNCEILATFRLENDDDYEYKFSVLSTRSLKNVGLQTMCACLVWKTRTRSRPRPPIYCSCHVNTKFISSSKRVISFLLYGQ